jgi:putative Ca2+/H+ antiporter (TMEM165/GDT1 family)
MKAPIFDPQVFWAAFLASSIAEVACLVRNEALAAHFGSPLSVFLGALLGNVVLLLPVLLFGGLLHRLPLAPVRYLSAAVFIGAGLLILFERHA